MTDSLGDASPVLMLGDALGRKEATVEDLLPREQYKQAVRNTGPRFTLNPAESKAPSNVRAFRMLFKRKNWGDFQTAKRASVILQLVESWGVDPSSVPRQTCEAASRLFATINERFERLQK